MPHVIFSPPGWTTNPMRKQTRAAKGPQVVLRDGLSMPADIQHYEFRLKRDRVSRKHDGQHDGCEKPLTAINQNRASMRSLGSLYCDIYSMYSQRTMWFNFSNNYKHDPKHLFLVVKHLEMPAQFVRKSFQANWSARWTYMYMLCYNQYTEDHLTMFSINMPLYRNRRLEISLRGAIVSSTQWAKRKWFQIPPHIWRSKPRQTEVEKLKARMRKHSIPPAECTQNSNPYPVWTL